MPFSENDFDRFMSDMYDRTGIDLEKYKRSQMQRRLTSLCQKRGYGDFKSYFEDVMKNQTLLDELLDRMTINVSEFFRNSNRWAILQDRVIPYLFKTRPTISIWSAACSTGEEPYSLAFTMAKAGRLNHVTLIATDIDERALERAKRAVYSTTALSTVPSELRGRYVHSVDVHSGQIDQKIRDRVQFHKHNLLEEQALGLFDLIVCRNVLIYFTEEAKRIVYDKLARSLSPGGILFVGSTEQIFDAHTYSLRSFDAFFYEKIS